jgi:hypothetical protein
MSRSAREVKEFFERVAGDWDTMRLAPPLHKLGSILTVSWQRGLK